MIGVDHKDRASTGIKTSLSADDRSLLDEAAAMGVEAVLLDNHPVALEAANYLHDHHPKMTVLPMVPYVQGVVDRASSSGLAGVAREMLGAVATMGLKGVGGATIDLALGRKQRAGARVALAHYLRGFPDRRPAACFLHNAITDVMLGWGNRAALRGFADACRARGVAPGFVTLNPGSIPELAEIVGREAWFMCAVNSRGIQMSPSRAEAEAVLANKQFQVVAMSVLGGGLLRPEHEIPRAYRFPAVRSVVIGTAKPAHLRQAFAIARETLTENGEVIAR